MKKKCKGNGCERIATKRRYRMIIKKLDTDYTEEDLFKKINEIIDAIEGIKQRINYK